MKIVLIFYFFILVAECRRIFSKSDLPQFRTQTTTQVPSGTGNPILEWKRGIKLEKAATKNDVFCKVYGLCASFSSGTLLLNMLAKWSSEGLIYPYKKYDGKLDPNFPKNKINNFVRTWHSSKHERNTNIV